MINILFVITGIIFRFKNIFNEYYFSGELGKELIFIRNIIDTRSIPLIGMPTSHEWLYYGPLYYYIATPIVYLLKYDPFSLFYISFFVSLLGLLINYAVIKKVVNKNVAIYSTVLVSLSPIFIWQTRLSKLHTFFFVLSPLLIYFLNKVWYKEKKYVFYTGIIYGLFFSFHFSQIPILITIVSILFLKRYQIKDYLILFLAVALPNITLLLKDLLITVWLPYRALGFSQESISQTIYSFNEFFGRLFFWDQKLWIAGSLISIIVIYIFVKQFYKQKFSSFIVFYLLSSTLVMFFSLILHRNPPLHYFLPIFSNVFLMLALLFDKVVKKESPFRYLIPIGLILSNLYFFDAPKGDDYVPIAKQMGISKAIVAKNAGSSIRIVRIGPYDYFPENYSQNYKYLINYFGGRIDQNSGKEVIINDYENINSK